MTGEYSGSYEIGGIQSAPVAGADARLDGSAEPAAVAAAEAAIPSHVEGIDGLRGLAALWIACFHIFTGAGMPEFRPWRQINLLRPMHDGWAAVNFFLVLSGFCLFWPYARQASRECHYKGYFLNRIRRIVPAYYASLLIVPALYIGMHWFGIRQGDSSEIPNSWLDVAAHLTLLHSLIPETFYSWNHVTWSLGLEWTWYLAFPFALWLFRRVGAGRGLLILIAITLAYRCGLYVICGPADSSSSTGFAMWRRVLLPGRLAEFGMGMYVAAQFAKHFSGNADPFFRQLFGRPIVALGLCLVAMALAHLLLPLDTYLPFRDGAYGLAFSFLLVAVADPNRGFVQRAFSGRLLDGLGQCSYSLFLLHMPIANGVTGFFRLHGITGAKNFLFSLAALPLMIFVARLSYRFIEAPFLRRAQIKHVPAST
jgi:peptidoglycan/LPS O-acetylase OafA/YrhL